MEQQKRKYELPLTDKEKRAMIDEILRKARELTDAGLGSVRFVERRS